MRRLTQVVLLAGFAAAGAVAVLPRGAGSAVSAGAPSASIADDRGPPAETVRYDRDVRPILSDKCFLCHGPDPSTRTADLRLDLPDEATKPRDGAAAIVPGDPGRSLLWQRVNAADPDELMPPADSGKHALSADQKDTLRRWIEAGAAYEPHWSFLPPTRPAVPAVGEARWAKNPIDAFVFHRLERAGLAPAPEADPATLLRRLFLDLTGLPPTPEELDAFLADASADAYERWVDKLLTEEPYVTRYAERMTAPWLDQARYADTSGIHTDAGRSIWPWRDWVLSAYRANMPFDRFVVEQLAGDLLPDATLAQRVATGFNRNHVTSDENGAIPEELLVEYGVDRVATTGSVFLGLTLGCARCHDHKFDPVTQADFFGLFAYFNNVDEPGLYVQQPDPKRAFEPMMAVPTSEQAAEQAALEGQVAAAQAAREKVLPAEAAERERFLAETLAAAGVRWTTPAVTAAAAAPEGATLTIQADGSVLAAGQNPAQDEHTLTLATTETDLRLLMIEALADPSMVAGRVGRSDNGNAVLTGVRCEAVSVADPAQKREVAFTWARPAATATGAPSA